MLMRPKHPELQFTHLLPYGALVHDRGVQFVVFSRSATGMRLLMYNDVNDRDPSDVIEFDRDNDRWGDIWERFLSPEPAPASCTTSRRTDRTIRPVGTGLTPMRA